MNKKRYKIASFFNAYKGREKTLLRTRVRDELKLQESYFSKKINCLENSAIDFQGRELKKIAKLLNVPVDELYA